MTADAHALVVAFETPQTATLHRHPIPEPGPGQVLVRPPNSGIGADTELTAYDFLR